MSHDEGAGVGVGGDLEFVLVVSGDEKLLRWLTEVDGAYVVDE